MKKFLPYILPIITILAITAILFIKPESTGFAVLDTGKVLNANIKITTNSKEVIPEDSIVIVSLNNKNASLGLKEFIEKSGMPYEYKLGSLPIIDYNGYGYTGDHSYIVNINEFDIDRSLDKGNYSLIIEIRYNDKIISRSKEEIAV